MMTILVVFLSIAPGPAPRYRMTYTSAARGVVKHADCAADHPDRFTASERTIAPTAKGGL